MICECYRAEKNFLGKVGLCVGTQERDACSCGGDKSNCDFYPSVREEEKKLITRADHFRSMTDDELARYIDEHTAEAMWCNSPPFDCPPDKECINCILNWLKEATEDAGDQ